MGPTSFEVVSFLDSSRILCEAGADLVAADDKPKPVIYAIKGHVLSIMQTEGGKRLAEGSCRLIGQLKIYGLEKDE